MLFNHCYVVSPGAPHAVCRAGDVCCLTIAMLCPQERLMLSVEQEILRVHGQAARALANQSVPLSLCAIMCDEAHSKPLEPLKGYDRVIKHSRSRYNGRQLISWQQDVTDKFEKIKVGVTDSCVKLVVIHSHINVF